VADVIESGRSNQRHRTRKDLLAAAARLLKGGRAPDMDAVAAEAMVSRATAYRYFPSIEALLIEAPLEGAVPEPHDVFAGDDSTDPALRIDKAEAALHESVYRNEALLRVMLAASLERKAQGEGAAAAATDGIPIRQNRRTPLIEAALAPARDRLTDAAYEKLRAALALIFGVESMVVFSDVLGLDEKTARQVNSWAARALVRAAIDDSAARR
jgi:AcrR family transcriptional regulator